MILIKLIYMLAEMPGIQDYLNQQFKIKIIALMNCSLFGKFVIRDDNYFQFQLLVNRFRNA